MAPKVQTLAQVMAELNPAYAGQEAVFNKQKALIPAKYDAQKSALGAEKVQGFNQINDQATGKGLSFSGIPVDEQATYLSTKYLPGMQKADADMNAESLAIQGELAKIYQDKTTKAMELIKDQKSSLNQWNLQQAQIAASAREAAATRAAAAATSASSRAAATPNAVDVFRDRLRSAAGKDSYVSPTTFRSALNDWKSMGGDNKTFMDTFWYFTGASKGQKNQKNIKAYYYG